jgi:hypothetical protein
MMEPSTSSTVARYMLARTACTGSLTMMDDLFLVLNMLVHVPSKRKTQ